MNYKPSFTEISSNEIQSWVNYGNPGETTTKKIPNWFKVRDFYLSRMAFVSND